ncbi:hypothetical protein [Citrobacter braakii]|uniref:hypothetical protein n=1 Tax=Citrobacter braakii TaxID=57706 RepID=UPI001299C93C|nr:hypothetical protein [Citrobacter braakii]MEB8063602.1 hypothetical protein [Citrobacter braakii]MRE78197.1 hypothetical protein [Citrobacter braakii]
MRRKFAVALDSSTKEQNAQLKKFIEDNGLGWWHWIANFWLLTDQNGNLTARDIRDKLNELYPGVHCIVLSIDKDEDTWSGFGPKGTEKNMFNWLKSTWDKDLN